jgi:hypothetical protein
MIKKIALLALCCTYLCANNLTWGLPQVLSTLGKNATDARIGIDASGNLVAAWIENNVVMATTQPFQGTWHSPTIHVSQMGASSLELVVDSAGNATAIWEQQGVIQSASLPYQGVWSLPKNLSLTGGHPPEIASSPQIAVDSSGNLSAIWQLNGVIQAVTKQFDKPWSHPTSISLNAQTSDSPQIAIGGNEAIVAVWHSTLNGIDVIYSSSTTLNGSWPSTPSLISTKTIPSVQPQVAVNSQGLPVAVWYSYALSGNTYSSVRVQTAFVNSNNKWNTPTDLSALGMRNPADLVLGIAFNQKDMPCVLWTNSYDASTFNLEGSVFCGGAWTPTTEIVQANLYLYDQNFVISPFSYAYAAYMAGDPSSSFPVIRAFKANTLNMEPNFGDILTISNGGSNIYPRIDGTLVNLAHAVGAIWLNYNGSHTMVQAAVARGVAIPAPTSLSVTQGSNNFGEITEYFNTLSWMSATPDSSSNWVIFRNGAWLQTLPITQLMFIDHNTVQNQAVTYGVALQTEDGDMSPISTVSFP